MDDRLESTKRLARQAYAVTAKYAVNVPMRALIDRGLAPGALALLETTGRRSGEPRRTPVGNGLVGDTFWVIAERGLRADYVRNLQADPRVRVKAGGSWRDGTAEVLPDDDVEARVRMILEANPSVARRADAKLLDLSIAVLGSEPVTVRIDLDAS
ncbi:nitroreductase/quinone reductase family protein [Solicola gregarius]|uniref:Nitroreductase family deazaflavin-dependent oxidoreductase n=1 Tax=Solicola gregarius TaxID=2908642 RepID=A0AA46TFW4_9ACTN|nr:nitroreductase/quinone reductase family protein [Solicola gregarius]UYM04599.1 nitroreductase family deazaflavin-dependent oxidoreductase [Solicola gregarius]